MRISPKIKKVWKNCVDLQVAHPLGYFKPTTIHEVIAIINEAEEKDYKVKAVGSGHSFSDVALTRDYLVDTHGLDKVLPVDRLTLKDGHNAENLFLTECGIRIHALNAMLDEQGKALINMGAYTGQTIIGAISTATHGSGITLDGLAGFVEAIVLVTEKGRVLQIERSNGISRAPIDIDDVQVELIQNDDVFLSSVVSMGCLGVIYGVVLRVCDSYLLREKRTFCTWDEVRPKLAQGDILRDNRHLEVLIDPYSVNRGASHSCLITERNICPPDTRTNWFRLHRSLVYTIVGWFIPAFVLHALLRFIFNHFPKWTPAILRHSLKILRDGCYIGKSFKVLDLGPANHLSAYSTEIAFTSDKYLEAVEALLTLFEKTKREGQQYITSPFSLRFVKTSDHYLAMQYSGLPGFVCMIEFPVLNGTIGGEEMLARVESEMYKYGGIPHWGQYNHAGIGDETLNKLYPNFYKWLKNYRDLCPGGTFQNDFTERCSIIS